jgi:regulator of sigma E protease
MMLAAVDLLAVVMTVVGLGGLIFFHELGHFLACRLTGTRVEAFSVGFGKEIIGWQRGPTRYRIGIVPLGGYVKMAAENPGEPNTGAPDEFPNKPFSQRLFIMSSGVLFNIVLAFVLFVWAFGVGVPVEQRRPRSPSPGRARSCGSPSRGRAARSRSACDRSTPSCWACPRSRCCPRSRARPWA